MDFARVVLDCEIEREDRLCEYKASVQVFVPDGEVKIDEVDHLEIDILVYDEDEELVGHFDLEDAPLAEQKYWLKLVHQDIEERVRSLDPSSLVFNDEGRRFN